jgi:hypothetical protein
MKLAIRFRKIVPGGVSRPLVHYCWPEGRKNWTALHYAIAIV